MSTETPRTDRMIRRRDEIAACEVVAADLARTLERELIGAQAELEAITDAIGTRDGHSSVPHVIALKATIAEQAKEIERLRAELARFTAVAEYRQLQADWRQCVCGNYRKGELTGGWQCPVHGQQW